MKWSDTQAWKNSNFRFPETAQYSKESITKQRFMNALCNYIDAKILNHFNRVRCKSVDEIRFKLDKKNSTSSHAEKANYIDHGIEELMKDLSCNHTSVWSDKFKKMRRQAIKSDIEYNRKKY